MFRFIQKYIDTNLIKAAFGFALIHFCLFSITTLIYKFHYINAGFIVTGLELIKDTVYNLLLLFIIFFGLTIHRSIFIFFSLILFVCSAAAAYYLFFFSIMPTQSMMPSIFGTHIKEVRELVSTRLIVWIIFSIGVCIYSLKHFNIKNTKSFITGILSAICLLLFIINIIMPKYSFLQTTFPLQYLHNSYVYFFGKPREFTREDITGKFSFEKSSNEEVIGVLVIGEAARYSNWGINGYDRDTTPRLSKMDIANFKARACASATYLSVSCMLSRYGESDIGLVDSETGVLSVLTKLGYETIWVGTQSVMKHFKTKRGGSFYDDVQFSITPGGVAVMLPNALDENILPYLDKNLKQDKMQFFVLHTTGSHWNYAERYTREFAVFKPEIDRIGKPDPSNCGPIEMLNSYDNSILYTDFFLSSVIERLKDKKAFLIYSSDHGESLGENGILTHGSDEYIKEQREVPFIVWFSDSYKKAHPEKWNNLKSKMHKEISHDYIFHTILDCLDIKSDAIDSALSLCSGNYERR